MRKIKKGDIVQIMRGKDAGKQAEVLKVVKITSRMKQSRELVVVKGVNVVKKAQKPNPSQRIEGGLIEIEKPVDISNVMLVDPKSKKPTRIGFSIEKETGKKIRVSKKSNSKLK